MSESNPLTSMDSNGENRIRILKDTYNHADQFAKEISEFMSEVSIPACNELRYAGHHLLKSLGDDGEIVDDNQYKKALSHCERAGYEAAEAGIIAALEYLKDFKEYYKGIVIRNIVPDYPKINVIAKKATDLLSNGRPEHMTHKEISSQYMDSFRELKRSYEALVANTDDLNVALKKEITEKRRYVVTACLSLLGIVITLVTLL